MSQRPLNCEEVIEQLFAYLDHELDSETSGEIERHLDACRGCCSRVEFERRLRGRMAETGRTAAPAQLHRRIKALINGF